MEMSLFGRLPREIRNSIYKLLVVKEEVEIELSTTHNHHFKNSSFAAGQLSVRQLCRQMQQESDYILWHYNTIVVTYPAPDHRYYHCPSNSMVPAFFARVGFDLLGSVRHLRLHILFQADMPLALSIPDIMGSRPKTYLQVKREPATLWAEAWCFRSVISPAAQMYIDLRIPCFGAFPLVPVDISLPFHSRKLAESYLQSIQISLPREAFASQDLAFAHFWEVLAHAVFISRDVNHIPAAKRRRLA